ncbi:benzoylformate decarboxylase [Legionella longbeachae]|nr:hypothetical protein LOR_46c07720 [Legionella oakridgensis RV-2-2007]KTD39753.1 hypothetical protein Loak_0860 [Legionella oakridgensis]STY19973.1 benzoylformate decarboxylase [Legionella longbeachae]
MGGRLYAIHSIWSAKKYNIPVIFVCFINQEYRILKQLWCKQRNTDLEDTQFIGLDFVPPNMCFSLLFEKLSALKLKLIDGSDSVLADIGKKV